MRVPNADEWANWWTPERKRVATDFLRNGRWVSTVFLGIDSNDPPLLFETAVFGKGGNALEMQRYSTWDEAMAGHLDAVSRWSRKRATEEV